MSEPSEQVEGQSLAASLLAIIDRGGKPDWARLLHVYHDALLRRAGWYAALQSRLSREFTGGADELLDEFLAHKVFPAERASAMLRPVAQGDRPLGPRLLASLDNYCIDLDRKGRRLPSTGTVLTERPAPSPAELPTLEAVEELIRRQAEAIRTTFDRMPTRAPYREALLLSLRVDWANLLVGTTLPREWGQGKQVVTLQTVIELLPLLPSEAEQQMSEQGSTLARGWERLEAILCESLQPLTGDRIAEQLQIPRPRWDAWVSRGRRKLVVFLGDKFTEIFPQWRAEDSPAAGGNTS